MPINAPLEYWDDSIQAALFVAFSLRYLIVLNISWLITSAHFIWGLDKKHKPSDSNMIFLVTKSYWPQYHYLLPFDYQTGEFGNYGKSQHKHTHRNDRKLLWCWLRNSFKWNWKDKQFQVRRVHQTELKWTYFIFHSQTHGEITKDMPFPGPNFACLSSWGWEHIWIYPSWQHIFVTNIYRKELFRSIMHVNVCC